MEQQKFSPIALSCNTNSGHQQRWVTTQIFGNSCHAWVILMQQQYKFPMSTILYIKQYNVVQPLSLNNIYINRLASLTCSFYFSRQFFSNIKDTLHIIHFGAKYYFGYLNYSANNGISFQSNRRVIALFISMWWSRVQSNTIKANRRNFKLIPMMKEGFT